ncbi:uncharacterized protein LOC112690235 [Sipha flava]|uniref:Uncharacterized protein LOC112690235 n=1 Tax=Sipha flava TaxID=143950 RepID=A0A2S2R2A1_9HEMI|nr:uncharacterized protein LOC112690235 [Sipha flava]
MYRLLILCLCCGFLNHASSSPTEDTTPLMYENCDNLQPKDNIKIQKITGEWYVIKVFQHQTDKRLYHGENYEVSTCPTIRITYVRYDSELRLYWEESIGNIEYRFKVNEKSNPGSWMSSGAQNGSLLQLTSYSQFAGTVYVMEAVNDYMVLTFCSPNTQFYSMILARKMVMDTKDLRSITNNITELKLPITQTKRTCRSSSSIMQNSMWLVATFCLSHIYLRAAIF